MSDYSQINDYSDKDALSTGDPLKLIKGSDIDGELAAISTAIASKFDSTDIATAGEAAAGTNNTKVITPARLTAWGNGNGGLITDIQALQDPNADRILFWDDSAGTTTFLTAGTGLAISATTISVDETAFTRQVIAGESLSGGGALSSDVTLDLDINENTAAAIAAGDFLVFADIDDSNISKKITFANLEATLSIANLSDAATRGVDLSGVTLTAGSGLSYSVGGTDLTSSATIDLDITELTAETTIDGVNDDIVFYDASAAAHRKVNISALLGSELGDGKWYRNATQATVANTEATVVYNAAEYDSLQRGTFSTSTGQYTVGSSAARIWIHACYAIDKLGDDQAATIVVQVNGTDKLRYNRLEGGNSGAGGSVGDDATLAVSGPLTLAASDVVRVRVMTSAAETIQAGTEKTYVGIQELG